MASLYGNQLFNTPITAQLIDDVRQVALQGQQRQTVNSFEVQQANANQPVNGQVLYQAPQDLFQSVAGAGLNSTVVAQGSLNSLEQAGSKESQLDAYNYANVLQGGVANLRQRGTQQSVNIAEINGPIQWAEQIGTATFNSLTTAGTVDFLMQKGVGSRNWAQLYGLVQEASVGGQGSSSSLFAESLGRLFVSGTDNNVLFTSNNHLEYLDTLDNRNGQHTQNSHVAGLVAGDVGVARLSGLNNRYNVSIGGQASLLAIGGQNNLFLTPNTESGETQPLSLQELIMSESNGILVGGGVQQLSIDGQHNQGNLVMGGNNQTLAALGGDGNQFSLLSQGGHQIEVDGMNNVYLINTSAPVTEETSAQANKDDFISVSGNQNYVSANTGVGNDTMVIQQTDQASYTDWSGGEGQDTLILEGQPSDYQYEWLAAATDPITGQTFEGNWLRLTRGEPGQEQVIVLDGNSLEWVEFQNAAS